MDHLGNGVEVRHLRVFATVAECGTLTEAAARLGTGQPGVTRTLAQLEARLGVRLVERTTRSLDLTVEGLAFRDAAARVLAALDDALAAVRGTRRPLRLGFSWSAAGRHTLPILRAWRAHRPEVSVELRRHDDRTAGLAIGQADLALVRARLTGPRYVLRELYREPRCVAAADGDPLATSPTARLADLAGRRLAVSSGYGTTTLSLWPAEARPRIVADARNIDDWLAVIGSGAAVGVTAESTAHQYPVPGIVYVPLVDAPPLVTWFAWEAGRGHPRAVEFMELAVDVVRAAGG